MPAIPAGRDRMMKPVPERAVTDDRLAQAGSLLAASGLSFRGGFSFEAGEDAPACHTGKPARSVLLIGNIGASFWPHFRAWRAGQPNDLSHPLDTWSRSVIDAAADILSAKAIYPSDRPFLPFQTWAMRAESLKPSPLGILIHPEYGLWHAYRGALLLGSHVELPPSGPGRHLCDSCTDRPCLKACPVSAHTSEGFNYASCIGHVRAPGGASCRVDGCKDRNACPYGADYRYPSQVQSFLMAAFAT